MTDEFNPERLNAALREVNKLTGIDMRPKTPEYDERVEARAAKLLQDVPFICEAFSEMGDDVIALIGELATEGFTAEDIGLLVKNGIREYALAVAKKELG